MENINPKHILIHMAHIWFEYNQCFLKFQLNVLVEQIKINV